MPRYRALTLAIHPTSKGFSWIAFENPFTIYDFRTVGARGTSKNERCLQRIERLIATLSPQTIVLEAFEPRLSSRASRVTKLGRAIVALAVTQRIEVAIYRFGQVQACFAHVGARTRGEIAGAVTRLLPEFARYLPGRRRAWQSEQWRLSLFCAAALALTHYQRDAESVLENLSS
jgi:Holliday junction resolvasome RuvABC endonuclease subunit